MNLKSNKTSEMYCKYYDEILKDKMGEEFLVEKAVKAQQIFKYIQAKDIFINFYNQRLIKRLFMKECVSIQNERNV